MRIRVSFAKTEAMRFTGHLDLHHAWERLFRRAGLPLAYSQGFHPQPRINLACALPLGFTSQAEIADIWLEQELPIPEIECKLKTAAPPGIQIQNLHEISIAEPALQTQVQSAEYIATLLEPVSEIEAKIHALLAAESLPRQRRGKLYDLRPLLEALSGLPVDENGQARLRLRLAARENATGRPEEVLDALGIPSTSARVHRVGLYFRQD